MVILGILGTCTRINGTAILQKGAPPSKLNSIAKLIKESSTETAEGLRRPSFYLGNFSRRPYTVVHDFYGKYRRRENFR